MVNKLDLRDCLTVLEPSAGDGAFVEELTRSGFDLKLFCIDKNPGALEALHKKFGENIHTLRADAILDRLEGIGGLFRASDFPERFDRIIGNPPYGGWLDYEIRATLKKKFAAFHVRETYALFLLRCVDLLKNGGILTFIVPDTFLAVAVHRPLRKFLLRSTQLLEIVTLPSNLFPGVAFGYSGLCIITLRKSLEGAPNDHSFRFISVDTNEELESLAQETGLPSGVTVLQREVLRRTGMTIWTSNEPRFENLLQNARLLLADVAECKTGIYSGDNRRFIRSFLGTPVRRSNYDPVNENEVCLRRLTSVERQMGIKQGRHWVPITKGGSYRFYQPDLWAIDWSAEAVAYYKRDDKARFQNSQFYFKQGIGIPMVTSSRVNAFLLARRVFDQSVVGIFPKRGEWLYPLLIILNSGIATRLLKGAINPTANNSANYLKRFPLPNLGPDDLRKLGVLARSIWRKRRFGLPTNDDEAAAESYIEAIYQQLPTKLDTSSGLVRSDADTPLFPYLRERPRSYGPTRTSRTR